MDKNVIKNIKNDLAQKIDPAIKEKLSQKPVIITAVLCCIFIPALFLLWINSSEYSFEEENTLINNNSTQILQTFTHDIWKTYEVTEFSSSALALKTFSSLPELSTQQPDAQLTTDTIRYVLENGSLYREKNKQKELLGSHISSFTITRYAADGTTTENTEHIAGFSIMIEFLYSLRGKQTKIPMRTKAFSRYLISDKRNPEFFSFIDESRSY